MTKRKMAVCSLTVAICLANFAQGEDTQEQRSINHLLNFVETSQCTFVRNGVDHDSRNAADHIKKKYNYFKNKIHTADDFIALAATKSELSGRPYFVRCEQGKTILSADWLREELEAYRKAIKKRRNRAALQLY